MATVIESLVVKLGLDAKGFKNDVKAVSNGIDSIDKKTKKAQKEDTAYRKKAKKEQQEAVKEQLKSLEEFSASATKLFATLTGGAALGGFISDTVKSSASLQRLSSSLGTSAGTLQTWSTALNNIGGNGEDAINTISGLTDAITSLKLEGNLETARWLSRIGVSAAKDGQRKSASELMQDIRSGLKAIASPEEQRYVAAKLGIGPDLLYAMNQTDEAWNTLINDAERQSKVMDELGPKSEKWMNSWRKFSSEVKSGALATVSDLLGSDFSKAVQQTMSGYESGDFFKSLSPENLGKAIDKDLWSQWYDKLTSKEGAVGATGEWLKEKAENLLKGDTKGSFKEFINESAKKYNVDERILFNLIKTESGFNNAAVSPKGAKGLAQFMPDTAQQYGVDVTDPRSSTLGAGHYLSDLLKMFGGDYQKALAGYNWGQGNVMKSIKTYGNDWLSHAPMETQKYVASTMSIGNVTINTQATDASGIARDFKGKMAALSENGMK
jgi:hypothetical protein